MIPAENLQTIMADEKDLGRHLTKLKPPFSGFVFEALEKYGDIDKLREANKVADFLVARLKKRGMYEDPRNAEWMAITYAATMVHNLFYDGSVASLFAARDKLAYAAVQAKVKDNHFEFICQHIEGQLGEDCPVSMCKVKDDSPQGMLALARWFVVELNGEIPQEA